MVYDLVLARNKGSVHEDMGLEVEKKTALSGTIAPRFIKIELWRLLMFLQVLVFASSQDLHRRIERCHFDR